MIPADHIAFDGNRAWLVVSSPVDASVALDRPCDTCIGGHNDWCINNCINGRHTFEIKVACATCHGVGTTPNPASASGRQVCHPHTRPTTYRVSIVAGMVLPIVDEDEADTAPTSHVAMWADGTNTYHDGELWYYITLPSAAKPGMWAVKLNVSNQPRRSS